MSNIPFPVLVLAILAVPMIVGGLFYLLMLIAPKTKTWRRSPLR